jgi:N-acetylglucosaminyldiphosphoundecaprenol N-acetyl-beta-D-mannosaminyltransferase
MIVYARRDNHFREILNRARIALPDGVGIMIAGKVVGHQLRERITGTDMVELICREVSEKPINVGFLGGRNGVAEKTANCLKKKYPDLSVSFVGEEWEGRESDAQGLAKSKTDILFVAFGFPKQEEWMASQSEKSKITVMMGVGGAFDYLSGQVPRAPSVIRSLGFEWLYRLIRQPWRIKRQLALFSFALLVIKSFLRNPRRVD